jgi:hypothetical protein
MWHAELKVKRLSPHSALRMPHLLSVSGRLQSWCWLGREQGASGLHGGYHFNKMGYD